MFSCFYRSDLFAKLKSH